ncbi:MAG: hypothetical protein LBN93_09570 [Candidatus Symbiothrix sp.]|jgi:hypothetical protein|nr:hypothetical protein [Candidatus Symbiothrix sp.]
MKRNYLLLLVTALLVAGNWSFVNGQVAIGDEDAPAADTGISLLLDATKGGLLLPQVEITSFTALPPSIVNPTPAPDSPVDPAQLGGLLVYNKTATTDAVAEKAIPVGIYYWDSTALIWKIIAE